MVTDECFDVMEGIILDQSIQDVDLIVAGLRSGDELTPEIVTTLVAALIAKKVDKQTKKCFTNSIRVLRSPALVREKAEAIVVFIFIFLYVFF